MKGPARSRVSGAPACRAGETDPSRPDYPAVSPEQDSIARDLWAERVLVSRRQSVHRFEVTPAELRREVLIDVRLCGERRKEHRCAAVPHATLRAVFRARLICPMTPPRLTAPAISGATSCGSAARSRASAACVRYSAERVAFGSGSSAMPGLSRLRDVLDDRVRRIRERRRSESSRRRSGLGR
jgi:hypothetical protein